MDIDMDNRRRIDDEEQPIDTIHPLTRKFYRSTFIWVVVWFFISCFLNYSVAWVQNTHFMNLRRRYDHVIRYDHQFAGVTCDEYHPPHSDPDLWDMAEIQLGYDQIWSLYGQAIILFWVGLFIKDYFFYEQDPLANYNLKNRCHLTAAIIYLGIFLFLTGYWVVHNVVHMVHLLKETQSGLVYSGTLVLGSFIVNMAYFCGWGFYLLGYKARELLRHRFNSRVIQA